MTSQEPPEHLEVPAQPEPADRNASKTEFSRLNAQVQNIQNSFQKINDNVDHLTSRVQELVLHLTARNRQLEDRQSRLVPQSLDYDTEEAPREFSLYEQPLREVRAGDSQPEAQPDEKEQVCQNLPALSNQDAQTKSPFSVSEQEPTLAPHLAPVDGAQKGVAKLRGSLPHPPTQLQEPTWSPQQLITSIFWDSEDFEDTWDRPHDVSWQSEKMDVPQSLQKTWTLKHGAPVTATTLSSFLRHAFTCGRDGVKVWSLVGQVVERGSLESHLCVQNPGALVRTSHLLSDNTALLMAGNSLAGVSVWDLKAPTLHMKCTLPSSGLSCQTLASSPLDTLALGGFSDGTIRIWDFRQKQRVRDLSSAHGAATRLLVKEHQVWAGSLDGTLQCWDLRNPSEPQKYQLDSQIMGLSPHPHEDFLLVGLGNGHQWLQPTSGDLKHMVGCRENTILDLAFSPRGHWWVSVGMNRLISIHSMPAGRTCLQVPESTGIMCCDVAQNDRLIITGSYDSAIVYQVLY